MGVNIFPDEGGGGGPGIFPIFTPRASNYNLSHWEGFIGNGDSILLPSSETSSLTYRDNTAAIVFTTTVADIDSNAVDFVTFMFDSVDNKIYLIVREDAPTPDTFHLASVDSSGTIINIGSVVIASISSFTDAWGVTATTFCPSLYRAAEGSGNFTYRSAAKDYVLSDSDASLVTEVTYLSEGTGAMGAGRYTTPDGISVLLGSAFAKNGGTQGNRTTIRLWVDNPDTGRTHSIDTFPPLEIGLPVFFFETGSQRFPALLSWKGYIAPGKPSLSAMLHYDRAPFDAAIKTLATNVGLI